MAKLRRLVAGGMFDADIGTEMIRHPRVISGKRHSLDLKPDGARS